MIDTLRPIRRVTNAWTLKEHEVVVTHWPDKATIRMLLPHRTEAAINDFASKCNLRRRLHVWTAGQDKVLRQRLKEGCLRKDIAAELGLTLLQVDNRMQYTGLKSPRRRPRPTGNKLIDAIRLRSFELNISMRELDEACKSGHVFSQSSPARHVSIKHVLRALKVLDGQLAVEWSPLDGGEGPASAARLERPKVLYLQDSGAARIGVIKSIAA
jgi:hypothetical protein